MHRRRADPHHGEACEEGRGRGHMRRIIEVAPFRCRAHHQRQLFSTLHRVGDIRQLSLPGPALVQPHAVGSSQRRCQQHRDGSKDKKSLRGHSALGNCHRSIRRCWKDANRPHSAGAQAPCVRRAAAATPWGAALPELRLPRHPTLSQLSPVQRRLRQQRHRRISTSGCAGAVRRVADGQQVSPRRYRISTYQRT